MTLRQWRPGYALADTTALTELNCNDLTGAVALNLSAGSGTRTASSDHPHSSGNIAKTYGASGQNSVMRYPFAGTATTGVVEWVFWYSGTPPTVSPTSIGAPTNGSVTNWSLTIDLGGFLVVLDTTGAQLWRAAAAMSGAGFYRFAAKYVIATTTTGTLQCAYYSDASTTAIETSTAYTAKNLGTANPTTLELGLRNVPATVRTSYHTDVQINDGATAFIGPLSTATPTEPLPLAGIIDSSGWVAWNGTTILANLSDANAGTGAKSGSNPVAQVLRANMPNMVTPTNDLLVNLEGFRSGGGTSSSVVAYVYEGTTLRATSNTITNLGTTNTEAVATFTLASLSQVTTSAWAAGTLELRLAVTAS